LYFQAVGKGPGLPKPQRASSTPTPNNASSSTPMNYNVFTPMGSAVGSTISGFFKQAGAVFSGKKTDPEESETSRDDKPKNGGRKGEFQQGKNTVIAYYQSSEAGASEYNTNNNHQVPQQSKPARDQQSRQSLGYSEGGAYSEYSEYSEFTNDFVGTIGARPYNPNAMEEVSLGSPVVNPNTIGARQQPSPAAYHQYPRQDKKMVFRDTTGKTGYLGARPLEEKKENDKSSQRAGSYDVFAPPGPIGIVVDTSKDGPAVHSLKSTSPMLGLISPGDLIVALDDEDTSGMTAATLTRLMAKKSRQQERKITLISMD
jgi:hypothetical protein